MATETYNTDRKRLLIHPGETPINNPAIYLDENNIALTDAANKSSILISKDFGIGLQGPISMQASPQQVRFAGLWKINPLVLTSLPSTIYTPIPWLRQSIPMPPKEMIKGIVVMASLLTVIK